ncbi:MAG: AmmeMemoRadiSam system protein A [Desulfovibrionaceae bacterium]|nr:AmmeMemoRadiSam system protein A [Desulfovibrionaceae bacterium]
MEREFTLELTGKEREYLLGLARLSIARALNGKPAEEDLPEPPEGAPQQELGAFVSLRRGGRLRGCIGRLEGDGPLYRTVIRMAQAAAFQDPRFPPLGLEELDDLHYELSIMGPITPCRDPDKIRIGRHGLIMKEGRRQGLLLPQVPVEWSWNREEFLRQTCRKAGLPPEKWKGTWKEGSLAELYWFEALVVD